MMLKFLFQDLSHSWDLIMCVILLKNEIIQLQMLHLKAGSERSVHSILCSKKNLEHPPVSFLKNNLWNYSNSNLSVRRERWNYTPTPMALPQAVRLHEWPLVITFRSGWQLWDNHPLALVDSSLRSEWLESKLMLSFSTCNFRKISVETQINNNKNPLFKVLLKLF